MKNWDIRGKKYQKGNNTGHFTSYHASEYINDQYAQGFCASTSAVNRMKFEMSSGNFDGVIQMYGIK